MKTIIKGAQPRELIQWRSDNAGLPQNLKYGKAKFPLDEVRKSLLKEQFHLCAYTMRRLPTAVECKNKDKDADTGSSCHIEHILPQSRKIEGEDIDYQNMVACYPSSKSNIHCEFGAIAKDYFDPAKEDPKDPERKFVSPLQVNAEAHFRFDMAGGIHGNSKDGEKTIEVLKLDHINLVHDRQAVITGFLRPNGKKVTAQQARSIARLVMQPYANNCLEAYCVAIAQAAMQYADREDKRAARMKGGRRA